MAIGHIHSPAVLVQWKILMKLIWKQILFFTAAENLISYICQNLKPIPLPSSSLFSTPTAQVRLAVINPLTPNDDYSGRTAPLTSKCCILYIYSTNIGTEYFKRSIYSPFSSLQNAVCFINLTYLVPVLFTFYIKGVLKLKNNSGAKRLNSIG